MSKIEQTLSEFEKHLAEMLTLIDSLTEEQLNWKLFSPVGSNEYWSIRQMIAHVEEVNYFWLPQIKELIANPSRRFGRALEEWAVRKAAVDKANERELSDMLGRIKESIPFIRQELGSITDEQMDLPITPLQEVPPGYEFTLSFLVNHVYPEHIEAHIKQMHRNLFAYTQYH
ncbi:hypothetical protein A8709_30310 [Paenibacillus pectinilyticus]|uniref:DinB-like domain-containing protein n=1 Tax=Paenibacillus pectinilyticus TaxID=512399 RepID=A0A1C0ZVS9_9BACL|nr:DinB family protein [Paenibacillus pectinilyticus]OCT12148.1 hypothetical protein A8709_30310 [Paenibacillus pectinilyticus]